MNPALVPETNDHKALRDLMGLMSLPAMWAGKDAKTILELMASAVTGIVPLAAIYALVQLPGQREKSSLLKLDNRPLSADMDAGWNQLATRAGASGPRLSLASAIDTPIGRLHFVALDMDASQEAERVWYGSRQAGFPSREQLAFLRAATTLASTGIHAARIEYERQRASQAKDEFLAMLGHELRNPLAPITTTLGLIRMKGSGHLEREHAVIERQVGHLSRLVDDLLDITRITRGKVELKNELFELHTPLSEAVEAASPLIEQKGQQLSLTLSALTGHVRGDIHRLRQVFTNILTNAAKYTPTGGHIAIGAEQADGWVSVWIQDDGIGISAQLLPLVFDLFLQAETSADRSQGGLGIGLAIVKKLVGLHGGQALAASAGLGCGSRFTVRLPLAQAPAAAAQAAEQPDLHPGATCAVATSPRRVLLVDDNLDAAASLAELLELSGLAVQTACDAPGALKVALAFDPDVCVLDIGLPGVDGYQLAGELMRLFAGRQPAVRLVALTGYGQSGDKARSRAAGFHKHLVKPVLIDELLAAVAAPAGAATAELVELR